MKTYLALTALVFGALTVVHIWRAVVEPGARNPMFYGLTFAAAALFMWATWLLRPGAHPNIGAASEKSATDRDASRRRL